MSISFLICVREREILNVFTQPTAVPQVPPTCHTAQESKNENLWFLPSLLLVSFGGRPADKCRAASFVFQWSYAQHAKADRGGEGGSQIRGGCPEPDWFGNRECAEEHPWQRVTDTET